MGWWGRNSNGGGSPGTGGGGSPGTGGSASPGTGGSGSPGAGGGADRPANDEGRNLPVPASPNQIVPFQEPAKPSRRAFLERQIADHIKDNPDAIARLIRRWLREDEE